MTDFSFVLRSFQIICVGASYWRSYVLNPKNFYLFILWYILMNCLTCSWLKGTKLISIHLVTTQATTWQNLVRVDVTITICNSICHCTLEICVAQIWTFLRLKLEVRWVLNNWGKTEAFRCFFYRLKIYWDLAEI